MKKEIYTKNQYYDKVNDYQNVIKELKLQLQHKNEEIDKANRSKANAQDFAPVDKSKLEELETKNAEIKSKFDECQKELSEQKRVNEIQSKQISLYVEELRRCCAMNIEMKNRLEELIKDKETLQITNDNYKTSNETLMKEKHDFLEQLQKSLSRETENKKLIEDLESKIVKPDNLAYVYNMKKETVLGKEDIQVN